LSKSVGIEAEAGELKFCINMPYYEGFKALLSDFEVLEICGGFFCSALKHPEIQPPARRGTVKRRFRRSFDQLQNFPAVNQACSDRSGWGYGLQHLNIVPGFEVKIRLSMNTENKIIKC
jgi:hypothetical protein